jgi:hypothetical protein
VVTVAHFNPSTNQTYRTHIHVHFDGYAQSINLGSQKTPFLSNKHFPNAGNRFRVRVTLRVAVYRQSVHLGAEPLETHGQNVFPQLKSCSHSPYITTFLTRGWVCYLQLLLVLASAFILWSESRGTHDHILLSQIRYFPFCCLLRLAGLRWRYSAPLPHGAVPLASGCRMYACT